MHVGHRKHDIEYDELEDIDLEEEKEIEDVEYSHESHSEHPERQQVPLREQGRHGVMYEDTVDVCTCPKCGYREDSAFAPCSQMSCPNCGSSLNKD